MTAYVTVDAGNESRDFKVERGVRQGDPMSPLLFNLVTQRALRDTKHMWDRRGYGTLIGSGFGKDHLTFCAFADDLTLVARSWTSLKRMILSLREALSPYGLKLHPSKCKVQTNRSDIVRRGQVNLSNDFAVDILEEGEGLRVLGTVLDLLDPTGTEVENRIATGWRMFWAMSKMLLNRQLPLNQRMKIFDSTVGSCVLWCCESWTPRTQELARLEVTRRAMMRRIHGVRRLPEESWLTWIQRSTHKTLALADRLDVRNWKIYHFTQKWRWAGRIIQSPDGSWTKRVTGWRDSAWQRTVENLAERPKRPSTRRWMRFEDRIKQYCDQAGGQPWMEQALDKHRWGLQAEMFAAWCAIE